MNAQTWPLADLLARSTDQTFGDTALGKTLKALPPLSAEGPWIAGGALRRTLLGQQPTSDFDLFFRDKDQLSEFQSRLKADGMQKVKETEHHAHYRGRIGGGKIDQDVQLIRFAYYQSAEAVIDSFDYTICQFVFDGTMLTAGEFSLWDLGRKRLAIHKVTFPVSTMRRMIKYTSQGFTACPGAMATILREIVNKPELQAAFNITYVD